MKKTVKLLAAGAIVLTTFGLSTGAAHAYDFDFEGGDAYAKAHCSNYSGFSLITIQDNDCDAYALGGDGVDLY